MRTYLSKILNRHQWSRALVLFLLLELLPSAARWQGEVRNIRISKNELLGKIKPWNHPELFAKVPRKYASHKYHWLRHEVWEAYLKMLKEAKKEGIHLEIVSSFRRWRHQNLIWDNKWQGKTKVDGVNLKEEVSDSKERAARILRYSAMPGTSRHHWGTEIDFNRVYNPYFEKEYGAKVYNWLKKNAPRFGFCQPYTEQSDYRPEGVWEEKWHWSYAPLSVPFLREYKKQVSYKDLKGFRGSHLADDFQVLKKYVEGIDPACTD